MTTPSQVNAQWDHYLDKSTHRFHGNQYEFFIRSLQVTTYTGRQMTGNLVLLLDTSRDKALYSLCLEFRIPMEFMIVCLVEWFPGFILSVEPFWPKNNDRNPVDN